MSAERTADQVLDREFLELRSRILELAAGLDRIDRASRRGQRPSGERLALLNTALKALLEPAPGRAEAVQQIFSLSYDPNWSKAFGLTNGRGS